MATIDPAYPPLDAIQEDAGRISQPAEKVKIEAPRIIFSAALAAVLLLWVAMYNGYPTVFSDTGGYLLTGVFRIALAPYRAPGYAFFTSITSLGASPWFSIVSQAILVVYVLYETFRYLIGDESKLLDRCLLIGVLVLAALTSLPWLVSLLMPDVFAGVLFLSSFLLAFSSELRNAQRILLAAIVTISIAAHSSLFPIAALYFAAVAIMALAGGQMRGLPSARSVMPWLLVPIVAAAFWTSAINYKMGLGFRLSPSRNAFLLGRLFGDGLAQDFLRENCPREHFISCQYLSHLPRTEEEFLFQHPLFSDLKTNEDEMDAIVRGTIAAYPRRFLISSARQTMLQLAALRTGDEIRTYGARAWNDSVMQLVFPRDLPAFRRDKQIRGRLLPLADALASVHTVVFWISVPACLLFAWTGRFRRINYFLASAIVFLVINAAVCGALAGVFDRYQSRVAWLMPFCLFAYLSSLAAERRSRKQRQLPWLMQIDFAPSPVPLGTTHRSPP